MIQKSLSITNIVLTCITCIVLISTCGSCTEEQAQQVNDAVGVTAAAAHTLQPVLSTQPWYVFVLLASDIATSVAAAWLSFKKQNPK
jgi:hypothetical protein